MIFLADIEIIDDKHYRIIRDDKQKNKQKKNKKKPTKQKKSGFTKLANKTAGMAKFSEGEIAIVKSKVASDVKTPLSKSKSGIQKTMGAKKSTSFHRKMK